MSVYKKMLARCGPQHWWPAEAPPDTPAGGFEVMLGAILTQNTNWGNVEKALRNLKNEKLMDPVSLYNINVKKLAGLIKPAGYFNVKAKRLKNFLRWLMETYNGDVKTVQSLPKEQLREELLSITGIGPETADSIVLYATGQLSFVVDSYTARIFGRHQLIPEESTYDDIKSFFENSLPDDAALFNEYHALIVRIGKEYCKKTKPRCDDCPLNGINDFPEKE